MAAIIYKYSGNDVFVKTRVEPFVKMDKINDVNAQDSLMIITSVGIQHNEIIQTFNCFDDKIRYLKFGKGLGAVTIQGIMFCDCSGAVKTEALFDMLNGIRMNNEPVKLSMGNQGFSCVLLNFNLVAESEPDNMINFTLVFNVVDSTLPQQPTPETKC